MLKMEGTWLLKSLSPLGYLIPHNKNLSFPECFAVFMCPYALLNHGRLYYLTLLNIHCHGFWWILLFF